MLAHRVQRVLADGAGTYDLDFFLLISALLRLPVDNLTYRHIEHTGTYGRERR